MILSKLNFLIGCALCITTFQGIAQDETLEASSEITPEMIEELEAFQVYSDSIEATFTYEYGTVQLEGGEAILQIPEDYKFFTNH